MGRKILEDCPVCGQPSEGRLASARFGNGQARLVPTADQPAGDGDNVVEVLRWYAFECPRCGREWRGTGTPVD